jgi:hypothetical protein
MKRAKGGATVYAGEGSNVLKEAEERKRGGKVHGEGEKGKERGDRRKRGGKVERKEHERKHGGKVEHEKEEHERKAGGAVSPGRKRGGGIGANLTPLSTAARIKEVTKGESSEDEGKH